MSGLLALSLCLPHACPCHALKLPGHLIVAYKFGYWFPGPVFKTCPLLEILDLAGGPPSLRAPGTPEGNQSLPRELER